MRYKISKTISVKIVSKVAAFCALAFACCAGSANTPSIFSETFPDVIFPDIRAAFEAYAGRWDGEQILLFDGKELGKGTFKQTCVARGGDDDLRIISTGLIAYGNQEAPTRSVMMLENGKIRADIYSAEGNVETYYGTLKMNVVTWVPKSGCLTLDVQEDAFVIAEKGIRMVSNGLRYIKTPQATGYLGTMTIVRKVFDSYDKSEASPYVNSRFGGER